MNKHHRIISAVALSTLLAVSLTGCLVKKETPEPPINRKQDNLRVYEDGDWILYNVRALIASTGETLTGTLKVSWAGPYLLQPPDNRATNYRVMKKLIEVNIDGSANPNSTGTLHYIQQLPDGTEQLVAMGHLTTGQYYWLNTVGGRTGIIDNIPGAQEPVTTLTSPLALGQQYTVKYNLMDDCTLGTLGCASNVGESMNNVDIVGDSTQINTNIGNYANPFQVNMAGGVTPLDITSLPLLFDIFDVCSDAQSTHNATLYIVPEIGVIQMSNLCTDISGGNEMIQYDITIDSLSSNIK